MPSEQTTRPWFAGTVDETGMTIRIPDDPYTTDCPILFDGEQTELVKDLRGAVNRRRDGGSTSIRTSTGELWLPIRGRASFDSKQITMDPDCRWAEIQKRFAR